MASLNHLDGDDDDFGGDFPHSYNSTTRLSGNKRSFGYLKDEDDLFCSKRGNMKLEETAMILSLRASLENYKTSLATCQVELEAAKFEIQNWHSAFEKMSFIPAGASLEPKQVINYLQTLKSSEESLREQLLKAKKKEAACILTVAKREQEIAGLKSAVRDLKAQLKPPSFQARRLLLDPAIHEEFTRLKNLVGEKDKKLKELQENIVAVNFTQESRNGKLLMARCLALLVENTELGNEVAEGEMHKLAMKLALQKAQNAELRSHFEGLYKHMDDLTDDVEKSNETVLNLRERLEEKYCEIKNLKLQLQRKILMEEKTDLTPLRTVRTDGVNDNQDGSFGQVG